ncbi:carbohydrate porin [Rivularia sp. UHCC 0363]|uniref:carbohydrate porin n=1 Tax=Rivularia sp. UHCC 0363 TaxID=3110244 RepID=UPI002B211FD3|nr:carbohydrate porin [Rivularia sp. UHCC 0363]MEA5597941.1 carbohydrate porin [Rivularia sp. UHCC 0363]
MSQKVLHFHQNIDSKPSSKIYSLFCSASFSILWMMTFSSSAIAQISSSSTSDRIVRATPINRLESRLQSPKKHDIQDLDRSIEQITVPISVEKLPSRISEFKHSPNSSLESDTFFNDFTAVTARDIIQLAFELPQFKSQSCNVDSDCTQTTSTFNQQLNLQTPSQQQLDDTQAVQEIVPLSIQQSIQKPAEQEPEGKRTLREPSAILQGVYVTQGGNSSARARVTGIYPLNTQSLVGGTLDLSSDNNSFDDSRGRGLNINELYYATSLKGLPNLRFVVGQMDLTSYFDRNSFAKDGASQFFNPVFQTNPALSSTGIGSRPGFLVNWNATDNIVAKAAIFSSSKGLSNLSLDGFAGEVGIRYGNAIIRGTYSTDRDAGNRDSFAESFGIARGNNQFGLLEDDRESGYGINAEVFIPQYKLGLFGRYGRYENHDLGAGGDTYSLGLSFLDLFAPDDRLGLAYGSALSNGVRQGKKPDVVELFYDLKLLPNLRFGLSFQGRDSFNESVLGVRVKSEFDITPKRRKVR